MITLIYLQLGILTAAVILAAAAWLRDLRRIRAEDAEARTYQQTCAECVEAYGDVPCVAHLHEAA